MSRERQRLLERLQECDALESQLSDWQHQLESNSAGGVVSVSSNTSSTPPTSPVPEGESPDRHFFGKTMGSVGRSLLGCVKGERRRPILDVSVVESRAVV